MTASHPNYVNASSQTHIEGLVHDPTPIPQALVPHNYTDTTTPPDDMMSVEKIHMESPMQYTPQYTPMVTRSSMAMPNISPTLLLRRKNRPKMEARISMPEIVQFDTENPRSPPPTEALMSPLPLANRLHAGHTPIVPRARSPLPEMQDEDDEAGTPEQADDALNGPLTLPPQPGDGTEDTISLSVLDAELERLRLEQEASDPTPQSHDLILSELDIAPNPIQEATAPTGDDMANASSPTKSRRHSGEETVECVDGVLLKKPRINFGAPLGQA